MTARRMKYNPAFLTEQELVDSFVVRHADLELITRVVSDNVSESNQHVLVIGPRGIGKTTLVLRVVAEVRRTPELDARWYPIVFAEESYQVATPGEFWLEALFHLGQQTKELQWQRAHRELSEERDEERLRERALVQLMDFADSIGRRILLVVENLNMLLGEQLSEDDAWVLRHTLLNEPRLMLLASATRRFEEVDNGSKAMFELFRTHELKPLTTAESGEVWNAITSQNISETRIRPIQILTGGSPRLLTIVASFGAHMSLRELMNDLTRLVDEHTEYFRSHLDALAPNERKVYLALAELWEPSIARDVGQAARLDVNKTSAFLNRLVERGAVVVADQQGRKKWYQVAERMYNIYYLMRRRGGAPDRVRAAVNFMVGMYSPDELARLTRTIAEEACGLTGEARQDHYLAFDALMKLLPSDDTRAQVLDAAPTAFFEAADVPGYVREWHERYGPEVRRKGTGAGDEGKFSAFRAGPMLKKGSPLHEAEAILREALARTPNVAPLWGAFAALISMRPDGEQEAESACRRAIELDPSGANAWELLGMLLSDRRDRLDEAEQAYRQAVALEPDTASAWAGLGRLLHEKLGRFGEAEQAYGRAVELEPGAPLACSGLIRLLCERLHKPGLAVELAERTAIREPDNASLLNEMAWAFYRIRATEGLLRAEAWAKRAVELKPDCGAFQHTLASVLRAVGQPNEALAPAKAFLDDFGLVSRSPDDAIDLFTSLAAAGRAREALDLVRNSPSAHLLEPLVVGLQLFLGEDVKAPVEIVEVARDVVTRIEERRDELSEDPE